jgi:hypothetical protein
MMCYIDIYIYILYVIYHLNQTIYCPLQWVICCLKIKIKIVPHFILIHEMNTGLSKNGYLHVRWESNEVGAETKAGTLTGSNADGGRDSVQDSKHDSGENGERGDLIKRQGALRDEDGSGGDNETLDQVLNDAIDNFSKSVTNHDSIFTRKKKTRQRRYIIRRLSLKHPCLKDCRDELKQQRRNRRFSRRGY